MSNLLRRVTVAAIGAPLLVIVAMHGSWPLRTVVMILQAGILWEWRKLCAARGFNLFWLGVIVAAAGVDALIFSGGNPVSLGIAIVCVTIMLLMETSRSERRPLANLGGSALYLIYAVVPLALWVQFEELDAGRAFLPSGALTALLVTTWMCDTGAYFMGRAFGRHKLYPAASPNKTIEGFVGGIVFAAVVLPIMCAFNWVAPRPLDYVILPLIVSIAGQCGDLLESLMKREVNVKDTSAIFPGHGGFLDRFDSLLLSTPFFVAYLLLRLH